MNKLAISLAVAGLAFSISATAQAAGDPVKGKATFAQCAACHKVDNTGKSTIGPNLFKVAGRVSGTLPGFAYSPAMKNAKKTWNDAALDAYLTAPMTNIPGNKMPYAGLKNPADRANVIAYLKTLK
ncbi:cytochrome c family protein [Novosphingobium flavum]|uniref:Cytochrome c family protein n=1 Tax=Novosphingobium flavum TaxID=1778672 RepID=A0A7X1FTT5_9SPHN|nr:cytochrome c family protein [Novosphingobium flavum]MBC2666856.1 cytochrome c family protein [Novosphingobium flavum]